MNSKAIKRQLLAAIAMVLVAAIALGSSTYAWFVASGTVTAEGMKVKAQSEGGLAISYGGGAWGTTAAADLTTSKVLYPISSADLSKWYHATAKMVNNYEADTSTRADFTDKVFATNGDFITSNSYVVMKEFQIESTSSDKPSKGLYVSDVSVTNASKTMSTALRVGVYYKPTDGTATFNIFGPVHLTGANGNTEFNDPSNNYTVFNDKGASAGSVTLATANAEGATLIDANTEISATNAITVRIFIWFEGEDHNLFSANFNAEDLDVSVSFTSISSTTSNTVGV